MIKKLTKVPVTSYPHYNNGFYYVPDDYDSNPDKVYPTILFFHGKGEAGKVGNLNDLEKIFNVGLPKRLKEGWKARAKNPSTGAIEDFIVIAVQDQYWSPYPVPMDYAISYFKRVEKLRIDDSRVYTTGLSSGGQCSIMYPTWNPEDHKKVTAIAAFSSAKLEPQSEANVPQLGKNNVPVFFAYGKSDRSGQEEKLASVITSNGGKAVIQTYDGGHCCWDQFYYEQTKLNWEGKQYSLYEWFLLFKKNILPEPPREPKTYTVTADANGSYTAVEGSYIPGDTILLQGEFKSILFRGIGSLTGTPITITNQGPVKVGDTNGTNGAAFTLHDCKNIVIKGTSKEDFLIDGSVGAGRSSYFDLSISRLSEGVIVDSITIRNGGTGILCKTSPTDDPLTWGDQLPLGPFTFNNIDISGTVNEAMYIGDTSGYYDLTAKKQVYITPDQFDPTHQYVEQRMLKDVEISNVNVIDSQLDGIQATAIIGLKIHDCEVTEWGKAKNSAHNGGILVGGKSRNVEVYNNYVHDGWGNMLQYYASGKDNATHYVHDNIFINNELDGVSIRVTDGATVIFEENTVAKTVGVNFRVYSGQVRMKNVILAEPTVGKPITSDRMYIYLEPNVTSPTEINVLKLPKYEEDSDPGDPQPCPECPPIPTKAVPVAIETWVIMSDGTKYKI